jgi:C-terminal processing protease CtpA/Prc
MSRHLVIALFLASVATAQQPQLTIAPHQPSAGTGFVGVAVWPKPDFRIVAGVLPNSPAARAGILAGDYILAIDQHSTSEMSYEVFSGYAWAPAGTPVELTLKRAQTGATETVHLERADPASLNPKYNDWSAYLPALTHE